MTTADPANVGYKAIGEHDIGYGQFICEQCGAKATWWKPRTYKCGACAKQEASRAPMSRAKKRQSRMDRIQGRRITYIVVDDPTK